MKKNLINLGSQGVNLIHLKRTFNWDDGIKILSILIMSYLVSCTKAKTSETPQLTINSIYVVNQGNYTSGNGSISYINKDSLKVTQDIYSSANGVSLGGQPQSLSIINNLAYIVVQSLGQVKFVDINTFKYKGLVSTGISSLNPRNIIQVSSNVAYLSDWNTNNVLVIDLNSNTLLSQITSIGVGPDFLYKYGSKVYVSYFGGYGTDNKIGVINPSNNTVENIITVGSGPGNMVSDANGKLWVLCSGAYNSSYSALQTSGSLVRINPNDNSIELSLSFNNLNISAMPSSLVINQTGTTLYYTYLGNVYQMSINSSALPTSPFINRDFYSLSIDPANNDIVASYVPNFTSVGKVIRYQPSGAAIDSFTVGIGPSQCVFR